ncbi:MAG: hypothetical protein H6964_08900 [Chromatiaceae bacterium]|nr:hypothetical protein [Chromatiaceae bacterium]MCP5447098.1 hypothetical protein [Chromatiaceae bacterium]
MTITEQIVHLSRVEFWLFFLLAAATALGAFYFAFRYISLARLIEDTPTTRIDFAQQGYVELNGTALPLDGSPLSAPLSGRECCWFRYKIEKKGNKSWRAVERQRSDQSFMLQDDTGSCRIDPEGARVTTRERTVWYGNNRFPGPMRETGNRLNKVTWRDILTQDIGLTNRYRYTEELILPQTPLYVMGMFKTLDEIDHRTNRAETVREILRLWKQDKASLLARFDRDRNGIIDQEEWQQARLAASAEGDQAYRQALNGEAPHALSDSGSSSQPFLISTLPQFDLVKRFKLLASGAITAFFIAGATGVWMFGTRLSG